MHIPDGFLNAPTWIGSGIVSLAGLGFILGKIREKLRDKTVALMGVMSAFVFAAQMINFPIAAGTSGHLLGGVLAAVLLGPLPAVIVITVVLVVQCLVFQDGGVTALGANVLNMAFVGTLLGYGVFSIVRRIFRTPAGFLLAVFLGAWFSVVAGAATCSVELWLSGLVPLGLSLGMMAGVHALIGIGEGIITCLVVSFVLKARPDLVAVLNEETRHE
ncbi:MAG: energy-coupling factor ABC transporter permease [Candidatus Omnitrophica bacterium]|nr:energy-coupling factor ABC transporter permease [Candidatus Omnitrophota bacterium]